MSKGCTGCSEYCYRQYMLIQFISNCTCWKSKLRELIADRQIMLNSKINTRSARSENAISPEIMFCVTINSQVAIFFEWPVIFDIKAIIKWHLVYNLVAREPVISEQAQRSSCQTGWFWVSYWSQWRAASMVWLVFILAKLQLVAGWLLPVFLFCVVCLLCLDLVEVCCF